MRTLLIAGMVFAGLTLYKTAFACEPCADQARKYRKCAQEARAAAVKTASWATQANTYKQQAQLCDQAAQNLESMYSQCKAGTPNKCGGGSGGSSAGAAGGAQAAGGGQPSLMDQTNNVFQSIRGQSEGEVRNGLAALRALNDELARAAQRGGGNANQAARAIGNASLEEDDGAVADPAGTYRTDPRPKPEPSAPAAPEPVVSNPSPGVTVVDFTTKEMNTLVPVGDPPPATPERLAEDMLTTAVTPPSPAPRDVLGIPVSPSAAAGGGSAEAPNDGDGPNGLHLSAEFLKTSSGDVRKLQRDAVGQKVNEWKAEALDGYDEAAKEMKEIFDPFEQAHTALTRDDGKGALAGGKVIALGAEREGTRKDLTNMAGVGGGAIDRSVRALNGGSEEEATEVEKEYLLKPESDYGISLVRHYLPRPAQKLLEMSERATAKFDDAAATAVDIVHHVKVYYGAAKETKRFIRAQARDAAEVVVDSVQSYFGGASE